MPAAPIPASPQSKPLDGHLADRDHGVRSRLLGQPGVTRVGRAEVLSDLDLGRLGRVTRIRRPEVLSDLGNRLGLGVTRVRERRSW